MPKGHKSYLGYTSYRIHRINASSLLITCTILQVDRPKTYLGILIERDALSLIYEFTAEKGSDHRGFTHY